MNFHVVLVRTESSGNVGATARAMANMGAGRLILVDPQCDPFEHQSKQMASRAQERLSHSVTYKTWDDFYRAEGRGTRIALSRRTGDQRKITELGQTLKQIGDRDLECPHLYLIFGPEADGLSSEDLAFATHICHLPIHGEDASLNLAQAALLTLFMVRQQWPNLEAKQLKGEPPVAVQPFYFPDAIVREWLQAMGFDIEARKSSAYLTLRKLFTQNQPTQHELQVLEAVLQQNVRKLKEKN